jgi:prevent-host-death family protein
MSKTTYRNRQGRLVKIATVSATKLKNEFGAILQKVTHSGAVIISRHDMPKAVLLSYDEFVSLVTDRANQLNSLNSEFDSLLTRMQTSKARKGMAAAFNATPAQLGRAAVRAARKDRRSSPLPSSETRLDVVAICGSEGLPYGARKGMGYLFLRLTCQPSQGLLPSRSQPRRALSSVSGIVFLCSISETNVVSRLGLRRLILATEQGGYR